MHSFTDSCLGKNVRGPKFFHTKIIDVAKFVNIDPEVERANDIVSTKMIDIKVVLKKLFVHIWGFHLFFCFRFA